MAKYTFKEIIGYIKMLRIDIIFLLIVVGASLSSMANKKLIQDKYCISDLGEEPELCLNLEKLGPEHEELKDKVLKFSTRMGNYGTIITTPSTVITSLLLGYWLDLHPGHLRYLMTLPGLGAVISTSIAAYLTINFEIKAEYLLIGNLASSLTGGISVIMVGVFTYLARRTPAKYRAARFAVMQFFIFIPMSIGTALGGELALSKSWFSGGHRNYLGVFMISTIFYIASMIWAVIFLYDAGDPPVDEDNNPVSTESNIEYKNFTDEPDSGTRVRSLSRVSFDPNVQSINDGELPSKETGSQTGSLEIASGNVIFGTVAKMMARLSKVLGRKRDNNKRAILWLILGSQIILSIDGIAESSVDFQFTQKVYHWDAEQYANVTAIMSTVTSICTLFLPAILIHKLHMNDTVVGIIGCVSMMLGMIVKGGLLVPWAYIAASVIIIPSGMAGLAIQSLVTRIVDKDEVGRIFSLLGVLISLGPIVASSIYTNLFNATLSTFPGLYHHITVVTITIPLIVMLWMDYTKESWDVVVVRRNSRSASLKSQTLIAADETDGRPESQASPPLRSISSPRTDEPYP